MGAGVNSTVTRVLIVDDHDAVREGLVSVVSRQADMSVIAEARNGQEAVEQYRRYQPDVTLMDLRMPIMDGVTAIQSIRAEFPEACVLVVTTFDDDVGIARALAAGAVTYLLKDAPRLVLLDTMRLIASKASSCGVLED
jgi:DNA-binding NarL/FixJ family response regulator